MAVMRSIMINPPLILAGVHPTVSPFVIFNVFIDQYLLLVLLRGKGGRLEVKEFEVRYEGMGSAAASCSGSGPCG